MSKTIDNLNKNISEMSSKENKANEEEKSRKSVSNKRLIELQNESVVQGTPVSNKTKMLTSQDLNSSPNQNQNHENIESNPPMTPSSARINQCAQQ